MTPAAAFSLRWLAERGWPPGANQFAAAAADLRAARYPKLIGWVRTAAIWAIELLFPLLLLGRFRRTSQLDASEFDALEQRAHHDRRFWVRSLFLLARLPLWEQLYPERAPVSEPHPLEPLLAKIPPLADGDSFDVVVIGSGAGGAPLAAELAGHGHRVAILESGGLVRGETTSAALEKYYLRQGFVGSSGDGSFLALMLGRNVGGTTPINSGTCLSPRREFLQAWDHVTGLPFSSGLLDAELERVKETLGVCVPDRKLLGSSGDIFERGLKALGREGAYVLPRNTPECLGLGRCPFGCPRFRKRSTDVSYLPLALQRGCRLYPRTRATHIRESDAGVEIECITSDARKLKLRARKCVIAAGALGTPRLIRANRLGTHWPRAGNKLKIHPATKVLALMPDAVHGDRGIAQGMGYLAPELPRIAFEGIFTPRAVVAPVLGCAGRAADRWLNDYERAASFGMMVLDRGRGTVRWLGNQPVLRYALDPEGVNDLARGMKLMGEAFFAAGAERVLLPLVGLRNEFGSAAELREFDPQLVRARNILGSGFHPQGTAGIGRVTDGDLRLRGCRNIFVSDASVFPDTPGVNPQLTIMALSLRLATLLHAQLDRSAC